MAMEAKPSQDIAVRLNALEYLLTEIAAQLETLAPGCITDFAMDFSADHQPSPLERAQMDAVRGQIGNLQSKIAASAHRKRQQV